MRKVQLKGENTPYDSTILNVEHTMISWNNSTFLNVVESRLVDQFAIIKKFYHLVCQIKDHHVKKLHKICYKNNDNIL